MSTKVTYASRDYLGWTRDCTKLGEMSYPHGVAPPPYSAVPVSFCDSAL